MRTLLIQAARLATVAGLLLCCHYPAFAQRVPDTDKMAGGSGKYEGRGVIYKRIDPITGKAYVGQSWNWETFRRREDAHNRDLQKKDGYAGKEYKFELLSRPLQAELDMVEEGFIRKDRLEKEIEKERQQAERERGTREHTERKAEDGPSDGQKGSGSSGLENKRHQVKRWEEERRIRSKESAEARGDRRRLEEERHEAARRRAERDRSHHTAR